MEIPDCSLTKIGKRENRPSRYNLSLTGYMPAGMPVQGSWLLR